ncbi:TPA: hypothetical protein N0F65_006297 [Lagenidium giganteum]|uniref:Cilia- and flagella-associated protein 36 n=1 Tax=Lagenidium giganteum TaxID=4803 RepID=A0AAV2YK79_9STRA|nr:TPA: hypothetical protein N0F65_006297 [Lagenidium giganteum]
MDEEKGGIQDPLVKALADYISSASFQSKFEQFFLEHALVFTDAKEHQLEYMTIYHKFQDMFNSHMEVFLASQHVTEQEFTERCQAAAKVDRRADQYLEIVVASMDYDAFYHLMIAMRGRAAVERRRSNSKRPLDLPDAKDNSGKDTPRDDASPQDHAEAKAPSRRDGEDMQASAKDSEDLVDGDATPRSISCIASSTAANMFELLRFRSLWGTPSRAQLLHETAKAAVTSASQAEETRRYGARLIEHVASQGYNGIEASLDDLNAIGGSSFVKEQLAKHNLKLIVGVYSGWVDYEAHNLHQQWEGVQAHLNRLRKQLELVRKDFDGDAKPMWINAHSGCDHWPKLDQMEYVAHALEIENSLELTNVSHETHRGRIFYSPWTTMELLEAFPSLKLTLDFSHWCVVAERLLDTPQDEEWIERMLPHVWHIHGRIGSPQSAQIRHPTDQHTSAEVARFDRLWMDAWRLQFQRATGVDPDEPKFATFTPEYGPIPYAQRHPANPEEPTVDIDQLCKDEANRQHARVQQLVQGSVTQ